MQTVNVGIYKNHEQAIIPEYATEGSACFDLSACIVEDKLIKAYDSENIVHYLNVCSGDNDPTLVSVSKDSEDDPKKFVEIPPHNRVLIPTGLIIVLPNNFPHVWNGKIYGRSGTSVKNGLILCPTVGVIDNDYRDEWHIGLLNVTNKYLRVHHGDRLAQAEIVPSYTTIFKEITVEPAKLESRKGGFGSTGT